MMRMNSVSFLVAALAAGALATSTTQAQGIDAAAEVEAREIYTNDPANGNTRYDVDEDDDDINSRFVASTDPNVDDSDNDKIVLRWDTSSIDLSSVSNASFRLQLGRNSSNNLKAQRVWGVNTGTANMNTWTDAPDPKPDYGDLPALIKDFDRSTQGVNDAETTFLGTFQLPPDLENGAGTYFPLTQDLLDTTGPAEAAEDTIDNWLQSLSAGDHVNLIIGGIDSSGTFRIFTRRARGDSAAKLVIPEPSSLLLLSLGGIALAYRRRR